MMQNITITERTKNNKKTILYVNTKTVLILFLLFGSSFAGINISDNLYELTKPQSLDSTNSPNNDFIPQNQFNTSSESWNTITAPDKQIAHNGISTNSIPSTDWQEDGPTVRVDSQAKNYTVKSLDSAYKKDFSLLHTLTLNTPVGVAVDSDGNVFVTSQMANNVTKYSSSGEFLLYWGGTGTSNGQFQTPRNLVVDSNGDVYVIDQGNSRVQKFNNSGDYITQWGVSGTNPGEFSDIQDITIDSADNIYTLESSFIDSAPRVQKFTSAGSFITEWGSFGTNDGEFDKPIGIATDAASNVYVADTYNGRIQVFDDTGTFLRKWATTNDPRGIAVTSSGEIIVGSEFYKPIETYNSTGELLQQWSSDAPIASVAAIAIDTTGDIYIADGALNEDTVYKYGLTTSTISPEGLLPTLADQNHLITSNQRSTDRVYESIHFEFSYFDLVSPTELGIVFSWETRKAAIFTSIFDTTQLTIPISDLAVYSNNELKIYLVFTYGFDGFTLTASVFDTGLNQYVFSDTTSGVSYFDFDISIIKIDYIWAESQEIESHIRSDFKYTDPIQTLHRLEVEVFDYRIPLALYTPLTWASPSIDAQISWDDTNKYWQVTNTVPKIYEIIFISGQGWGNGYTYNSTISPVIDVTSEFMLCPSFECGNVTADISSLAEISDAIFTANTTIISQGGVSLRMEDTEAGDEGINLRTTKRGQYTLTFDTYLESGHTWENITFWWRDSTSTFDVYYFDAIVADRWQKHIVNFTLSGDDIATTRNMMLFLDNGQGVGFFDNIKFWQMKPIISTEDLDRYLFSIPNTVLDGHANPTINDHPAVITLKTHEPETTLKTWTLTSNDEGNTEFEYNGELIEQGYTLEYSSTLYNATTSEYYFTPLLASHYTNNENYDVDFDDGTFEELIDLDSDTETLINGTLGITSTGSDYWAYYNSTSISAAYSVSARMKYTGGSDSFLGISFYDIPTSSSLSDDVFLMKAGTAQTILSVAGHETYPVFVSAIDTWYVFRVDVTTDYVRLYIDNVFLKRFPNINPLTNPYFGVYGYDSDVQVDFVRIDTLTQPSLITGDTETYVTSANNTIVTGLYSDGNYLGLYDPLSLIALNFTAGIHNITAVPVYNSQFSNYVFATEYYSQDLSYIYDGLAFQVSVTDYSLSDTYIQAYAIATIDYTYITYLNNSNVGVGSGFATGTSIQVTRDVTVGLWLFSIAFTDGDTTVWFNSSYSNAETIGSGDMSISLQNGIGQNIPFETFATYYRFNGTAEYSAMSDRLLYFINTNYEANFYLNDSFGQEISNTTTSFTEFYFITISAYEIFFTNNVNQSLLVQIKLGAQAWGEAVGYWVGEGAFRTIRLFSGTYDARVLGDDGVTVLQTFTLTATSDQVVGLEEGMDLISYGYSWDVEGGNVTITLSTNYGDSLVEVIDNGISVGTFKENETVSWPIATGVNVSQVEFYVKKNITKYGGSEEQSLFRGFAYAITLDDYETLLTDISWIETNDQFNITVVSNQLYSTVTIRHDGILNATTSLDRVFVIDKDTTTAGNHNITLTIGWFNSTGYRFTNWFILSYWTASYYTVSIDVIPTAPGLRIKTNEIDMTSFNVYLDGVLVNKEVPDPFKEQTTEQINSSVIFDGTLWVRSTAWNHTLTIKDKWDVSVYSTEIDLRDFIYRVYELPLAKITLRTETTQAIVVEMYYWNQTTNAYVLGPELHLSPTLSGQTAWVVSGIYSALMYDVETRSTVVLDKKVTKRITVENTGLELDAQDILIGEGEFELAIEETSEGTYQFRLEPSAVIGFDDIDLPSESELADKVLNWLEDNFYYIGGFIMLLIVGWYLLKAGTKRLSKVNLNSLEKRFTKKKPKKKPKKPNGKPKAKPKKKTKPKPKPEKKEKEKGKPLWQGFVNKK